MTSLQLVKLCRKLAEDKKAVAPVIMDLRKINAPASFFLVCSGLSEPQVKAIFVNIEKTLKDDYGVFPEAKDGSASSKWIALDYGSVIIHIFDSVTRPFYDIERLWSDAPRIN